MAAVFQTMLKNIPADDVMPFEAEKILVKFSFSLVFVILMWISANSFVYLPFTPVPGDNAGFYSIVLRNIFG